MSSDRLILDSRKSLSLSKSHKRLSSFISRQLASQPSLLPASHSADISAVDDETSGERLRAVDRVKVADHIMYQLTQIRDAIDEERRRERTESRTDERTADSARHKRTVEVEAAEAEDDNIVQSSSNSATDSKRRKNDKKRKSGTGKAD